MYFAKPSKLQQGIIGLYMTTSDQGRPITTCIYCMYANAFEQTQSGRGQGLTHQCLRGSVLPSLLPDV